ncbi:MAG: PKD domain-containing protein [Myxococcota bacterium]|nr:PKD domain-containing protein [Myxococcota bacterium]
MRAAPLLSSLLLLAACAEPEQQVEAINNPPVADAGANISQTADQPVKLEGGGSFDPDGDAIAFTWSFDTVPAGSTITNADTVLPGNGTTSPTTQFSADVPGTYIIGLTVQDARGATSEPSYVVVQVIEGSAPVANAGADIVSTMAAGELSLDGAGSYDPLGRDLTYAWTFESVPTASALTALTGDTTAAPTFTPDIGGRYVVSLVVNNGFVDSAPDTTVVQVAGNDCAPDVDAGADQAAEDCSTIQLDGSGTFDCDPSDTPQSLQYYWELQTKPAGSNATTASLSDRTAVSPTFYADVAGSYTLSLTAFDGENWGAPDTVVITASERSFNTPPQASAGAPKSEAAGNADCEESGYTYACDECDPLTIALGDDATATDADGDPLVYAWTVLDGDATIADPAALTTTVRLEGAEPTEPSACEDTTYEFQLQVTDCTGAESTSTVTYTASCCGISDTAAR